MWSIRVALIFLCLSVCLPAYAQTLAVTGTLSRAMAVGGESTGWTIQLDTPVTVDGKELHSLEVDFSDKPKLDSLDGKHVGAKGKISHRKGVETGDRVVLELSSIRSQPEK
jgi:hypothetical protein